MMQATLGMDGIDSVRFFGGDGMRDQPHFMQQRQTIVEECSAKARRRSWSDTSESVHVATRARQPLQQPGEKNLT